MRPTSLDVPVNLTWTTRRRVLTGTHGERGALAHTSAPSYRLRHTFSGPATVQPEITWPFDGAARGRPTVPVLTQPGPSTPAPEMALIQRWK